MAQEKDEKTEKPTGRRLSEAKKQGDVARSKDLGAALGLMFSIFFFAIYISYLGKTLQDIFEKYFKWTGEFSLTQASAFNVAKDFSWNFLKLTFPFFILLVGIAVVVEIIQGGQIKIVGEKLKIQWEKVFVFGQLASGLKKVIMSVEALFDLLKSIVKVIVIGFIAYYSIVADIDDVLILPATPLSNILDVMGRIILRLSFNITLFLLVVSILDYLWQKYRYLDRMKMSKQDVKDEYKQLEGDPQVKSKQRQIQFQRAMQRMMAEVPEADVVITNPTHYAVALKYEYGKMHSPKLLAKGKDLIALKIKEVAKENNVPIVENPPVARTLFGSVEIGEFIPGELFKPVAEILAYIYKLKGKTLR